MWRFTTQIEDLKRGIKVAQTLELTYTTAVITSNDYSCETPCHILLAVKDLKEGKPYETSEISITSLGDMIVITFLNEEEREFKMPTWMFWSVFDK